MTLLASCSGGADSKNPFLNANTGIFTSADQPVGRGVARTFTDMKNGVPIRQGIELTPGALEGLPTTPGDLLTVPFIGPMPSTTNGSPFSNVFLVHVTSHPETNEPAHFHLALLIRGASVTAEPFTSERAPVLPNEIPPGYVRTSSEEEPNGVVVSGGGVIYDDPRIPAGEPANTTLGQNYLYFEGHMNGMILGPTLAQLRSKQTIIEPIAQPAIYPRDGYYPTTWTISYDTSRQTHVISMGNFIRAPKFVPPGS